MQRFLSWVGGFALIILGVNLLVWMAGDPRLSGYRYNVLISQAANAQCGAAQFIAKLPEGRERYALNGVTYNMTPKEGPHDLLCVEGQKAYWKRQ